MDLVTGGAGFLGSHLVDRLLAEGRRVRVLDTLADAAADPADRRFANVERWVGRRVEAIRGDVRDGRTVRNALQGVERVFHLAARVGGRRSVADPIDTVDVNVRGLATVLAGAEEHGVSRVVLASTAAALGPTDPPADEAAVPRPVSPYGAAALGAEGLLSSWIAQGAGRSGVALRLSTVYGPRDRPDTAVARFLAAARDGRPLTVFGDGRPVRDWLWVHDAVEALFLAGQPGAPSGTFHAGSGVSRSVSELVDAIRDVTGLRLGVELFPLPPGDPAALRLDPALAAARLGWRAQVPLREGLAHAWARVRGRADPL